MAVFTVSWGASFLKATRALANPTGSSSVMAIAVVPSNASRNGSNLVPITARLATVFFTTR